MESKHRDYTIIKPFARRINCFQIRTTFILVILLTKSVCANLYNSENRNSMLRTRVISSRYGKIQGVIMSMDQHKHLKPIEVYLGVPYATPPIGSNRFAPTRAPAPWDGIKSVDQTGPVCPQRLPDISNETLALQRMPKGRLEYLRRLLLRLENQSEDCLYMNVYAPVQVGSILESKHPVMMFIHGESYEWNGGNPYEGAVLASYAGIVVITINYRLGVLGFLNANPRPHVKARVANYGLMDQIAALHWVQQNIALFGGDPSNVTLMGHGTGAACINFLMMSPTVVPGLFHRAVLLSGSALSPWALVEDPVSYSIQLAKQANCTIPEDIADHHEQMVDCLRDLPLAELMNITLQSPTYLSAFGPSIDGVVVKTDYAKELLTHLNEMQGLSGYYDTSGGGGGAGKNEKRSNPKTISLKSGQNKYDVMFGVVTAEALWQFSAQDIQAGFEGDRRDRIIRTFVRNTYTYHLNEIFYTIVNEYTDWERTVQHPINTRDATVQALSDAQFVAPLLKAGELLSAPTSAGSTSSRNFFYVFDYQTKDGDYPQQRMGSVHGEELPYLLGAPLVDGFGHFTRNYTKSEVALSEAFILFVANFARTGNPNDHQRQEATLPISRERNRFRSIVWDPYDTLHHKYLEIGMKPRMKNHYRAHQLSVWLRLIPEIHRAGMKNALSKHNMFYNHNDEDLYDGYVRPNPAARSSNYMMPTSQMPKKTTINVTNDGTATPFDVFVTACVSVATTKPSILHNSSIVNEINSLEAASYTAYSTALSVTIAIGCSLLILNVLIFAGVYYQRDKNRLNAKSQQHQKKVHDPDVASSKHPHYFVAQPLNSTAVVDIERRDKTLPNSRYLSHYSPSTPKNAGCHDDLQLAALSSKKNLTSCKDKCTTLPKKMPYGFQNRNENQCQTFYMTLPQNTNFIGVGHNLPDVQAQTGIPPNGGLGLSHSDIGTAEMGHHFPAHSKQSQKSRLPQAALSEMNV